MPGSAFSSGAVSALVAATLILRGGSISVKCTTFPFGSISLTKKSEYLGSH